jgi:tetratricopeptide (TPR) repeat protein
MTKAGILALLAVTLAAGADDQQAALARKAKSAFDRAMLSAQPQLGETIECVQDQAALLPLASRDEAPLIYFRKGYCALIAAAMAENAAGFQDAAAAFDQAVSTWQARFKPAKGMAAEAGPSVLMALSGVARLEAGAADGGAQDDMMVGVARNTCSQELMNAAACQAVFRIGREWLGWMALGRDDLREAASYLADQPDSCWTHWVKGKRAFAAGHFRDAAIEYGASLELWRNRQARWPGDWMARLGPRPRLGAALTDLGGARLLAGETAAAITTLGAALDAEPRNARACYLRARAKEQAGLAEAAAADYNLAVRTAFAGAEDLVSGEARLYRGILLYRRKDYSRAEDEFSSALNAGIPADMRADAVAWRHMAAVAGGACSVSLRLLGESLESVSPYFPKTDARAAMASCPGAL